MDLKFFQNSFNNRQFILLRLSLTVKATEKAFSCVLCALIQIIWIVLYLGLKSENLGEQGGFHTEGRRRGHNGVANVVQSVKKTTQIPKIV